MSPEPIALYLVRLSASHASAVREAASMAFPDRDVRVSTMPRLDDALVRSPADGEEIVVLGDASSEAVARAAAAIDAQSLPRWGVMVLGDAADRPGIEVLSSDEMETRLIARVLRSSRAQWRLRRDVERERGDVWTLGRRLTHDLRNPLGCIVTTAEMMREVLEAESSDQTPLVESIIEGAAEMLDLINRIHFMAKASAQPRLLEKMGMDGVRQAAIDRLQREITRRGAAVSGPDSWPEVVGVRPWLEAVWGNLISNALRHGRKAPRIETTWRREAGEWRFEVTDDGPGVPSERRRHLFIPFHRLHQNHGTGLGLSIVHRLVHLHGGRCGYETGSSRGTTFYFTLPADGAGPAPIPGRAVVANLDERVVGEAGHAACAAPAI